MDLDKNKTIHEIKATRSLVTWCLCFPVTSQARFAWFGLWAIHTQKDERETLHKEPVLAGDRSTIGTATRGCFFLIGKTLASQRLSRLV